MKSIGSNAIPIVLLLVFFPPNICSNYKIFYRKLLVNYFQKKPFNRVSTVVMFITISASGKAGVKVMVELCQGILDGKGMPDEWQTSVLV